MPRKSQIHREKDLEQRQVAANQARSRIPANTLTMFEGMSDSLLEATSVEPGMSAHVHAYAKWELDWRRAYGWVYEYDDEADVVRKTHAK